MSFLWYRSWLALSTESMRNSWLGSVSRLRSARRSNQPWRWRARRWNLGESPEVVEQTITGIRSRDAERFALEAVGGIDAGRSLLHGNRNAESKP